MILTFVFPTLQSLFYVVQVLFMCTHHTAYVKVIYQGGTTGGLGHVEKIDDAVMQP